MKRNLYTYVIKKGKENEVMIHPIVEAEIEKLSEINQTRAKAVREIQEVLASLTDYDLDNVIENNVFGKTSFTKRDVRIVNIIHGRDIGYLKGKTTKKPSKMPNKKGQVIFTMYNYVEDITDSVPPDMGGIVPDQARSKLFNVHETSPRLGTVQANFFIV